MDKQKALAPVAFSATAEFAAPAQDGTRRFSGTAYGGGVITDHPYYDRVAFDLATTKLATPAPLLFDHHDPIGVIDKAVIDGKIALEGKIFSDLAGPSKQVTDMADRGMPWQMSVGIRPGQIDQVKAGTKIRLNGHLVEGPLTVFRNNRVRETSFVPLGADDQTNASVFTIGGDTPRTGAAPMSSDETVSKADHDRIVAEMKGEIETAKAATLAEKTRADGLAAQFALQAKQRRTDDVKQLFADCGREFKDEVAKPYVEMSDEAFSAVAKDLRASAKQRDPKLFREQAKDGNGGEPIKLDTAEKITAKAEQFRAEQAKAGKEISVSDAVAHVMKAAA